jgi:photosystem II stability/assembly factor-like uncharacterized protein
MVVPKIKFANLTLGLSLLLLAAGCNAFGSKQNSAGVVKTTNGGADWQYINKIKDSTKDSLSAVNVSTLTLDPANHEVLFASSYNLGLYQSQDSGGTWTRILSKIGVFDLAIDPRNSKVMFAAGTFAAHGRVYQTKDGGKSWQEIFTEGSANNPVRAVALNPSNPDEVIIGLNSGALIRSIDGGITWQLMQDFQDKINRIHWTSNGLYVLTKSKGLIRSTDSGQNFQTLTAGISSSGSLLSSLSSDTAEFSQFQISSSNPEIIYVATSGGLFKTRDLGRSWAVLRLPMKDGSSLIRAVAIFPGSDDVVYVSAGANIYKSVDGGTSWQTQTVATGGFINYIVVDPQLGQIAYAGIFSQ